MHGTQLFLERDRCGEWFAEGEDGTAGVGQDPVDGAVAGKIMED